MFLNHLNLFPSISIADSSTNPRGQRETLFSHSSECLGFFPARRYSTTINPSIRLSWHKLSEKNWKIKVEKYFSDLGVQKLSYSRPKGLPVRPKGRTAGHLAVDVGQIVCLENRIQQQSIREIDELFHFTYGDVGYGVCRLLTCFLPLRTPRFPLRFFFFLGTWPPTDPRNNTQPKSRKKKRFCHQPYREV